MIRMGPGLQPQPPPFRPLNTFTGGQAVTSSGQRTVMTHEDLASIIAGMTETELAEFNQVLGRRFAGSSDTLMLTLVDHGPNKISIIKIIRNEVGLQLSAAKKLVDSAPVNVTTADRWTVQRLASHLRAEGATVTVS